MKGFEKFGLRSSLNATLREQMLQTPTEIQERAIPALLDGRSVVGVAETGGGKTLAYVLPLLNLLKNMEDAGNPVTAEAHPRAAVLVPSRDLGEQVAKVFKLYTHGTRLRVRTVLGGTPMEVARRNASGVFEVLVATPGRLLQLMDRELLNLSDVQLLVFDEADQMLDQGFLPDAERIAKACPRDKQMALFSATVSAPVQTLIEQLFSNAEFLRSSGYHRVPSSLKTINRRVKDGKRFPLLQELLEQKSEGGTLLFVNTREQCDKLAAELDANGYPCVIYRGEMDKVERRSNLKAFREGKIDLLVSTDLAARGLDVEHIDRVINYHLPQEMENYLHRAGRTARAGRPGTVINLVTERDQALIQALEAHTPARSKKS
jgi:superfamily II DNA/RNA helicase